MNNYSWLQRKLHSLALDSQLVREATFGAEMALFDPVQQYEDHVFIAGLARSGTTILLNSIHKSGNFASLAYSDMPFLLAPNIWAKIFKSDVDYEMSDRAHGDGIKINANSVEAFEEVFWKTFSDTDADSEIKFRNYVKAILMRCERERYLSKNNQNIKRIDLIRQIFPCAKILIPFRSPLSHSFSLLSQHKQFLDMGRADSFTSEYMRLIGHTEFGPHYRPSNMSMGRYTDALHINHWLEEWHAVYTHVIEKYSREVEQVRLVCFEELCTNTQSVWQEISQFIGIQQQDVSFELKPIKVTPDLGVDLGLLGSCESVYQKLCGNNS